MLIVWLLITGMITGWIASALAGRMPGGIWGSFITGFIGAIIGHTIAGRGWQLGLGGWHIPLAIIGAAILTYIVSLFGKKQKVSETKPV